MYLQTYQTLITPQIYSSTTFKVETTSTLNGVACFSESNTVTVNPSGPSSIRTITDGNWPTSSTWKDGSVPGTTSGTLDCPVTAGHNATLTGSLSITRGVYKSGYDRFTPNGTISVSNQTVTGSGTNFTSDLVGKKIYAKSLINYGAADPTIGTITAVVSPTQLTLAAGGVTNLTTTDYFIGTDVTDPAGGTYHNLTFRRGNSNNNFINGILDVKSGITNFEGNLQMQATSLIVRSGATVIIGPRKCNVCDPGDPAYDEPTCASTAYNDCRQNRLSLENGVKIVVEPFGRLIIYGNAINDNNKIEMITNGLIYIVGNYSATGTQDVEQQVIGGGDIFTT